MSVEGEFKKRIKDKFMSPQNMPDSLKSFLETLNAVENKVFFDILDEARKDLLEPLGEEPFLAGDAIVVNTLNAEEKLVSICRRLLKWFGEKK